MKTLRQEKEILRKAAALYSPGKRSGVGERLEAHRCGEGRLPGGGAMQDARSLQERYYARCSRPPSQRTRQDALLTEKIRQIHSRSRKTYGYPRVHAELRSLGIGCGQRRVARLMKAAGLRGCMRGKKRRTTRRNDPRAAPAPDLLCRDFVAVQPNRVWLADITYIPTREGFLYLAYIMDTHSRRIVGWLRWTLT